jgi:hypothetical protein
MDFSGLAVARQAGPSQAIHQVVLHISGIFPLQLIEFCVVDHNFVVNFKNEEFQLCHSLFKWY